MNHNDESYAAILLSSVIRPDRDELAEPLSSEEWHDLRKKAREKNMRVSDLIGMDMSALMIKVGLKEEEAYRVYLLLNRMLPMSICLEKFAMRGIEVTTYAQSEYPEKLRTRLGDSAPAAIYVSGRTEIFKQDAIAVIGAVKPRGNAKSEVASFVRLAVENGYVIVTDATAGLSQIARDEAIALGGRVIEVLSGEMSEHVETPAITAAIARGEDCVISVEHPDKPCAALSALARNKIVYALCQSAFVFGVERNSGAVWTGACEAVKKRWCPRVYAWDTKLYPDNEELIKRGATGFYAVTPQSFSAMREAWLGDASKQICMFDNEEPIL